MNTKALGLTETKRATTLPRIKITHNMKPLNTSKRAYVRHYTDNDQRTAYVEWSDGSRTEGNGDTPGVHMLSLFTKAQREGIRIERETW